MEKELNSKNHCEGVQASEERNGELRGVASFKRYI